MLGVIVSALFLSLVSNMVLKKLQLPTIIGYIFTGTAIAYGFDLHDAVHNAELMEIAEFGVVFLMFTIGLEFSLEHLKRMRYEVFVTGTLQIVLTTAASYLIAAYLLNIEHKIAFVIALSIALSSTAIVLKTFNETGEISRRHGQRALGILIMQDIAVIPILLIIGFMSESDSDIGSVIGQMLLHATLLLGLLWIMGKYLLEPFLSQIIKTNSDELFVGTILFLAIGASYLAHELGFSYSLGAFIAGMLIAETRFKHQAEADLVPFRDLLLGVFFITVGMQIDFAIIAKYLHVIIFLLAGVMVLKFTIIYVLLRMSENRRVSLKTAIALVQIGEFSLALLELARTHALVVPPYGQVMIVTIVLSMIATPLLLRHLSAITDLILKPEDEETTSAQAGTSLENHTLILGFGTFGQQIADGLSVKGLPYIAIENNVETYHRSQSIGATILFGNAAKKEVLLQAAPHRASRVIVAIDNPKKLYTVCQNLLRYTPKERIVVKVRTIGETAHLRQLGIEAIIVENDLAAEKVLQMIAP